MPSNSASTSSPTGESGGGGGGGGSPSSSTASDDASSPSFTVAAIVGTTLGAATIFAIVVIAVVKALKVAGAVPAAKAAAAGSTSPSASSSTSHAQTPGGAESNLELAPLQSPSYSSSVSHSSFSTSLHEGGLTSPSSTSPINVVTVPSSPAAATAAEPGLTSGLVLTPGAVPFLIHALARAAALTNDDYASRICAIASCVAFVRIGRRVGSGFLLAENLFVTCHHVIRNEEEARTAEVILFPVNDAGSSLPRVRCRLHPAGFFVSSAAEDVQRQSRVEHPLDYVLVELQRIPDASPRASSLPHSLEYQLAPNHWQANVVLESDAVRVVGCNAAQQVPFFYEPRPLKRLGYNRLGSSQFPIEYLADTEPCYSGGVVVDADWQILGMHQGYSPAADVNQGIPIQVILQAAVALLSQRGDFQGNPVVMEQFECLLQAQQIEGHGTVHPAYNGEPTLSS